MGKTSGMRKRTKKVRTKMTVGEDEDDACGDADGQRNEAISPHPPTPCPSLTSPL